MRPAHYLKPYSSNATPHECVWVDTETDPIQLEPGLEKHILREGMAAHQRVVNKKRWTKPDWLEFRDKPTFWEWLQRKARPGKKLYVFAHNWGYDFPVLDGFGEMRKMGFELVSSVIESPPVILTYKKGKTTIQFIDTLNIWRTTLKALGHKIGLEKLDMPNKNGSKKAWRDYNRRDVEIIMKATREWFDYLKENDLGGFANTLAAQALRTFKHRFMYYEILIDNNEDALNLARESMHGGRTECFYLGKVKEHLYKIDFNSMYPSIMHDEELPTKLIGFYNRVSIRELANFVKKTSTIATVYIDTDEPVYPVMRNGKLLFPIGSFETTLTTPEIKYALEHKHIVSVKNMVLYQQAEIFKQFVHHFYELRKQQKADGDDLSQYLTKILMNSLYGKFGQSGRRYEIINHVDDDQIKQWVYYDRDTDQIYNFRQYGGIVEQFVNEGESRDSHPAIASHVTAYARIKLWEDIKKAGVENVYYCDTDSIWCNKTGFDKLKDRIDERKLGAYALEGETDDCTIYGPKDYVWDGVPTLKGIKSRARKLAENKYEQEHFSTLKGLIRKGALDAPIIKTQTKELYRAYNKGLVLDTGRVLPFDLVDGEL